MYIDSLMHWKDDDIIHFVILIFMYSEHKRMIILIHFAQELVMGIEEGVVGMRRQ